MTDEMPTDLPTSSGETEYTDLPKPAECPILGYKYKYAEDLSDEDRRVLKLITTDITYVATESPAYTRTLNTARGGILFFSGYIPLLLEEKMSENHSEFSIRLINGFDARGIYMPSLEIYRTSDDQPIFSIVHDGETEFPAL